MSSLKNIYAAAFVCAVRLNNDEEWQEQSQHCDLIFSKKKLKKKKAPKRERQQRFPTRCTKWLTPSVDYKHADNFPPHCSTSVTQRISLSRRVAVGFCILHLFISFWGWIGLCSGRPICCRIGLRLLDPCTEWHSVNPLRKMCTKVFSGRGLCFVSAVLYGVKDGGMLNFHS